MPSGSKEKGKPTAGAPSFLNTWIFPALTVVSSAIISFPLVSVVKFFVPQDKLSLQKEVTEKEVSPGIYEVEHYVPVRKKEAMVTTEERHLE